MNEKSKVFAIGLQRTGTTSLRMAIYMLGYDMTPPWQWTGRYDHTLTHENIAKDALNLAARHEAGGYMPFSTSYKELYERYPDAKFVLGVRDEQKWLKGLFNFFSGANWPEVRFALGADAEIENEQILLENYRAHIKDVREFFADKPDQLLEMDISSGDGWEKLCPFLDKEVPDKEFPHGNARGSVYNAIVKRAVPVIASLKAMF